MKRMLKVPLLVTVVGNTRGCICPRVGPRTKTGVRRRVCRRIGRAVQDGVGLTRWCSEGWMGRGGRPFGMSPSGNPGMWYV